MIILIISSNFTVFSGEIKTQAAILVIIQNLVLTFLVNVEAFLQSSEVLVYIAYGQQA